MTALNHCIVTNSLWNRYADCRFSWNLEEILRPSSRMKTADSLIGRLLLLLLLLFTGICWLWTWCTTGQQKVVPYAVQVTRLRLFPTCIRNIGRQHYGMRNFSAEHWRRQNHVNSGTRWEYITHRLVTGPRATSSGQLLNLGMAFKTILYNCCALRTLLYCFVIFRILWYYYWSILNPHVCLITPMQHS